MRKLLAVLCLSLLGHLGFGQNTYYTVIQAGGNIGIQIPKYEGSFNGYSLHFIFGRNFNEKAFLGLGLGNETLRGDYSKSANAANEDVRTIKYDRNLFPIFIDGRLPFMDFGLVSKVGALANVGYAPSIGPVYDRGFMGKMGFFYLYDSIRKTKFTVSATYAVQQLRGNFYESNFTHQHINLSVGIMLK